MPSVPRLACLALVLLAGLGAPGGAGAATLSVQVSSPAGRPLADAAVWLEPVGARLPTRPVANVQIAQRERQFRPQVTLVTVGTPVTFPNLDTVRHHVYSFSPVKTFELKLYAGTPHEPVVFDRPGIATLGCNIHDSMIAWVVVVDTPLFGRTGADGQASLAGVPPGSYRLQVWHPDLPENAPPQVEALSVGTADAQQRVVLARTPP